MCICVCFSSFLSILSWSLSTAPRQPANLPVFLKVMPSCLPNQVGEETGKEVTPTENLLSPGKPARDIVVCVECLWEGLCLAYVGMGFQIWEGYGH